ncbi:MAG: ATP-binding protein, partial [Deltaproteobacteria bacterium]|nr:ATP-binding protein [Deltaproteobacteria bacterium]
MNYKLILLEQREEVDFLFKEKIIAREKLKEFQPLISSRLIKVVSGIRRCGKSVLIHHALRESKIPYAYVNFDDERLLGIKASDLNDIFETLMQIYPGVTTYYFDEIQNVLGWELFVNRLKRQGLHIYVTGSNAKLLSKELATHLTGRHLELELMPFSFREFLAYHDISPQTSLTSSKIAQVKKYFEKYFENGGFPEVVAGEQPGIYLRTLFDNIMMRDIVARYHLRYPNELKELGRYILGHPGMRFTYNSLNKTFKVKSVHTLQKYIAYLKETYLVYELLQFDFKKKERLKKPRKLYPCDIGIHRALGMESYQGEGRRLELMILSCLVNSAQSVYYGEVSSSEIDFITEKNGKVTSLIQSCYSIKDIETMQREIKALEKGAKHFHCTNLLV